MIAPVDLSVELVHGPAGEGLLGVFNRAGVIGPAEVHTARRLAALGDEPDEQVLLAVALAVRAPRVGHVSVDLRSVRHVVAADADRADDAELEALPWPEPTGWRERVIRSPLVDASDQPAAGATPDAALGAAIDAASGAAIDAGIEQPAPRPVRLEGWSLYLDRYWRDELTVAEDLRQRAEGTAPAVDEAVLDGALQSLWPDTEESADQLRAARAVLTRRFSVIAGGPGTGKTTTVARALAALDLHAVATGRRPPLVALAAPTGKAAARLEEAVRAQAAGLGAVPPATRDRLAALAGTTLHRLLGSRPGTTRLRYHRGHRLPHDVVIVDEASMVSLGLMARLVEAVRPDARLVLVGDPEQLVSVEAGAVLADIAGPTLRPEGSFPAPAAGGETSPAAGAAAPAIAGCVTVLQTTRRFAGALAELAAAVRAGDTTAVVAVLRSGDPAVAWEERAADGDDPGPVLALDTVGDWARRVLDAARDGRAPAALAALADHRILCAHRSGPAGATAWNAAVDAWLAAAVPELAGEGPFYAGRPVIVTGNDYGLRLFNGDTGVAVAGSDPGGGPGTVEVVFPAAGGALRPFGPSRLAAVDTVWAMTVHKSQGSEFDRATLLLPAAGSRLLTRELLYTAVTRARRQLTVIGTGDALAMAVERPQPRASGLTARLWGGAEGAG